MSVEKFRGLALACGAAMMLLAMPGEGKACCCLDGLFGGCCGGAAKTTYAPPYAPTYAAAYPSCGCAAPCSSCGCAAPCSSCGCAAPCATCAPQTCMYLPQTYYRTYYRPVAVTAYSPVTTCSPCSGCCTSYYPTTAWSYQPCLVPYTTYRVVYSNPCLPAVSCAPCGCGCGCGSACGCGCSSCGSTCGTSAGCPSCGVTAPANLNPVPAESGATLGAPAAAPEHGAPALHAPAVPPAAGGTQETYPSKAGAAPAPEKPAPPTTFDKGSSWQRSPVPSAPANGRGPALPAQPVDGRTTSLPVYRASYYQLIASPPKSAPVHHDTVLDDSGWHAAGD